MRTLWKPGLVAAAVAVVVAGAGGGGGQALAGTTKASGAASGLGPLTGSLPRKKLTLESAINVDLSKETVRLPLYKGRADGKTVWYVLLDASDPGAAHNLGLNHAPKLANVGIGCPDCVQTVTLDSPAPAENPFGQAVVNFAGAPDFSPKRVAQSGPAGFPLAKAEPGSVAGKGYSVLRHSGVRSGGHGRPSAKDGDSFRDAWGHEL